MRKLTIKVYRGFGHDNKLQVFGHLLYSWEAKPPKDRGILGNLLIMLKLFLVKPIKHAAVEMTWNKQKVTGLTGEDGFFSLVWTSDDHVMAGAYPVTVTHTRKNGSIVEGTGVILVPHATQTAMISDIDDTLLISHSSTILRRLLTLFNNSAHTRKAFEGVADFYRKLEFSGTNKDKPNPFFYVSSSEWNLYQYLQEFFAVQKFPEGILLLNQIKRWYQLIKTGKTKHMGKFTRIVRLMESFPRQRFILIGDNTQKDPEIYSSIVQHFPDRIIAVYIRRVIESNAGDESMTEIIDAGIPLCSFVHTREAVKHAAELGVIENQI